MTPELGGRERAKRNDRLAGRTRILDRARHQPEAGALPPEGIRHAGVIDDDLALADLGEGHFRLGPVRQTYARQGDFPPVARAFVEDVLSIAGISTVGGRSAADIAERFLARAAERENPVNGDVKALLGQVLAIVGDPDAASASLRALADQAALDLNRELDAFDERTGFLAARGVDVGAIQFSAGFARNLDYYTGFIFELHDPARGDAKPVAGGGRYDNLLGRLGAKRAVPAVGASLWLDRLAGEAA